MAGKKESALELAKLMDKSVRVKLAGGREGAALRARPERDPLAGQTLGGASAADRPDRASLHAMPAVSGVLKGYDQLLNLVLDEAVEYLRGGLSAVAQGGLRPRSQGASLAAVAALCLRTQQPALTAGGPWLTMAASVRPADPEDPMRITDQTRNLGLMVGRAVSLPCALLSPAALCSTSAAGADARPCLGCCQCRSAGARR
jgi:hypothetical protein